MQLFSTKINYRYIKYLFSINALLRDLKKQFIVYYVIFKTLFKVHFRHLLIYPFPIKQKFKNY